MTKNYEFLDDLDLSLIQEPNRGKWFPILKDFMKSEQKYCLISFTDEDERNSCKNSLRAMKKRHNLQITFGNYGSGIRIYIAKA